MTQTTTIDGVSRKGSDYSADEKAAVDAKAKANANAAFNALAPSQTGNNGKYLTTNGTNTSWATITTATTTVDGLIKLGDATVQSVAANAVTATTSRSYALQLNASGQGVVNVPWTDTTNSPGGSNTQVQYNNAG
mgnify:CR=1 FL=1